jgi:hypothetical protein
LPDAFGPEAVRQPAGAGARTTAGVQRPAARVRRTRRGRSP